MPLSAVDGEALSGTLAGRYRVIRQLGSGGMGVVYEAEDTLLQRRVALKTLPPAGATDPAARQRLRDEARSAARINHPQVVTVFDVASSGEIDFLVMELLPLGSLGNWLTSRGPLPWRLATRLIADACRGLAAAHDAGLVHRDIKPSNLLVAGPTDGQDEDSLSVKLGDFGLSRAALHTTSVARGFAPGTVHYMSPEQCEGKTEPRSDLYSLGATYYALLTGQPPFLADHPLQVMFRHWSSPIPDPSIASGDIPDGCGAIIRRAMCKQPHGRYRDANQMRDDLERLQAGQPLESDDLEGKSPVASGPAPAHSTKSGRSAIKVALAGAAIAAACLAVVVLAWSKWHGRSRALAELRRAQAVSGTSQGTAILPIASTLKDAPIAWRPGFRRHSGEVLGCSLSSDGRYLACALGDGGGLVWDVAEDEYCREIESPTGSPHVSAVAFTSDPQFVVAAVGDIVQVHSIPTGRYERLHKVDGGRITSLAANRSGRWLAVADDRGPKQPGCIWLHQLDKQGDTWQVKSTQELANPNAVAVRLVAFSPDGELLVSYDDLGTLVIRHTPDPASIRTLAAPNRADRLDQRRTAAFSPDSRRLAAAIGRRIVVWDAETWTKRELAERHPSAITCLAWSADGQWLISAAGDGLLVWDLASGQPAGELLRLDGADNVRSLVFLGGGEWLLTAASDKRFLLWSWRRALPLAWQLPEELRR